MVACLPSTPPPSCWMTTCSFCRVWGSSELRNWSKSTGVMVSVLGMLPPLLTA